jgi:hypothetical protein
MNGREYLFSGLAMGETRPQQMLGGTDVISVGEQCPTCRATLQVHLLFNCHAEVLHDMEPIRDLYCLWGTVTGGLCV